MTNKYQFFRAILVVAISTNLIKIQAQDYELDPGHTLIEFNVERFMVGEVTGKFKTFEGNVVLDKGSNLKEVSVIIQTSSLDSDHEMRDSHLRSTIWLDSETYDQILFETTGVRSDGNQQWVDGNLTIKNHTNPVSFPVELKGPFKDPTGTTTIGLSGDLVINRQDYGITFSKLMDNGELFIGNEVRIRIRALAALK